MKEKYVPQEKYLGDPEKFERLNATIQKVIARDPKLRFVYRWETLKLRINSIIFQLRKRAGML
jgi:hypothetical protein